MPKVFIKSGDSTIVKLQAAVAISVSLESEGDWKEIVFECGSEKDRSDLFSMTSILVLEKNTFTFFRRVNVDSDNQSIWLTVYLIDSENKISQKNTLKIQ